MSHWNHVLYSSDGTPEENNHLLKIKRLLKTRETVNIDLAFQLLRSLQQPADLTLHRLLKATDLNKTLGLYFEQGTFRFLPFKNKSLSLANCGIQCFPQDLSLLSFLQHLHLAFNLIESLPETIYQLPVLRTLDLTQTSIAQLPAALPQLRYIEALYLYGTPLEDITLVTCLPYIQYLSLNTTQAKQLTPELIAKWPLIKHIYVYEAYQDIPEVVSNLPMVKAWEKFVIYDDTKKECFVKFDIDEASFAIQIGYWGNRHISELEWAKFERWLGIYRGNPLPETHIKVWFYYQDNIGGWQILMRLLDNIENTSQLKVTWFCDEGNMDGWEVMEALKDDYLMTMEAKSL